MNLSESLLSWFASEKRDLPWRRTKDPYRIWLSEIMLQQTRVETVKEYYRRFLEAFPDVGALAAAPEEAVLKLWEGLGYYSRARNLQKAAKVIAEEYGGVFPGEYEKILALPGIGPYTTGAIASIAFSIPVPAIDGNVNRVAARIDGIREEITLPSAREKVERFVREHQPADNPGDFNQSLMELGAMVCKPGTPDCASCPVRAFCDAYAEQDADLLPVHEKKALPRRVDMAVCLLEWEGKIAVMPRKEALLKGLYVFLLLEEDEAGARLALSEEGLKADLIGNMGHARHVFTHRVWEMEVLHFRLREAPGEEWERKRDILWADAEKLSALPFPTAMKKALAAADRILRAR